MKKTLTALAGAMFIAAGCKTYVPMPYAPGAGVGSTTLPEPQTESTTVLGTIPPTPDNKVNPPRPGN